MGADHPLEWARDKRRRLEAYAEGELGEWAARARDVVLPGLPVAVLLGFAANGNAMNTTGWLRGDQRERDEAIRKGKRPFAGDPTKGYGAIGSKDLHELGEFGIEGGHEGTPCATDPDCAWVVGARSEAVAKILGRPGVEGERWYKATADNAAIGTWNIARHMEAARRKLAEVDPRLAWPAGDTKPVTLWRSLCGSASWSAGSGGFVRHVRRFAAELAALPENARVGRFLQLAAREDDPGNRHRQDEWTALRWAQKHEAAAWVAPLCGEAWALEWLRDDGLSDADRAQVYARLVDVSS